jgi:hypothetical protein
MSDRILKLRILLSWLYCTYGEWRRGVWSVDLDSRYCCDGRECGCYGASYREVYAARRADTRTSES